MYKWIVVCRLKNDCRIKFGLVFYQLLAEPAQILSYNYFSVYNSLSAAIHLHMIRAFRIYNVDHKKSRNAIINSNYNMTASFLFPQFDLYNNIHIDPRISRTMHTLSPVKFRDLNLPRHIVTSYQLCTHRFYQNLLDY